MKKQIFSYNKPQQDKSEVLLSLQNNLLKKAKKSSNA